jgi:hypothetical protein
MTSAKRSSTRWRTEEAGVDDEAGDVGVRGFRGSGSSPWAAPAATAVGTPDGLPRLLLLLSLLLDVTGGGLGEENPQLARV